MHGTVRIENEKGLCIVRTYKGRKHREGVIEKIVRRYRLSNYTITITPDDDQEDGYDIKHSRSTVFLRNTCTTCLLLQTHTVVGFS